MIRICGLCCRIEWYMVVGWCLYDCFVVFLKVVVVVVVLCCGVGNCIWFYKKVGCMYVFGDCCVFDIVWFVWREICFNCFLLK